MTILQKKKEIEKSLREFKRSQRVNESSRSPAGYVSDSGYKKLRSAVEKAHDELLRWHKHSGHPDHPAEIALHILMDALKET